MNTTETRYQQFRHLHRDGHVFVVGNPWDTGSARILASLGYQALATTSAGYAFAVGKRDSHGSLSRAEILENAAQIVAATDLPVSADLEDGFGPTPEDCAETIRQAIAVGLVGGSIEDATGDPAAPIYPLNDAVARIKAAAQAAQGQPFLLTARAENFLCGCPDLDDTIARLRAYAAAGADVLYAPGLPDLEAIRTVCQAVDKPVNVVMGLTGPVYSVAELAQAGVRRVSVGGSFARAALGALVRAGQEALEQGNFTYAAQALPGKQAAAMTAQHQPRKGG